MARYASLAVIILVLLAVGWLFMRLMSQFFFSLFLAALLVVIFRPLHNWMLKKCKGRHSLAAGLTTTAIMLIVIVPFLVLFLRAGIEAFIASTNFDRQKVVARFDRLRGWLGLELPTQQAEQWQSLGFLVTQLDPYIHEPETSLTSESLGADGYLASLLARIETLARALDRRVVVAEAAEKAELFAKPDRIAPDAALAEAPDETVLQPKGPPAGTAGENEKMDARAPLAGLPMAENPIAKAPAATDSGLVAIVERSQQMLEMRNPVGLSMTLADVPPAYLRLRQTALGGPLRAYLIEWANPSPELVGRAQIEVVNRLQRNVGPLAVGTSQFLGGLLFSLGIVSVTIFFLYADGPGMLTAVVSMLPVEESYVRELLTEFDKTCRAVVAATLLSAFAQGLLAGIGYYFAGLEAVFLLTVVTMLMALVPFVGPAAIWAPCSFWLMFVQENHFWSGVGLFLFGMTAVSTIDNLVKPYVLSGQARLHPLPALLSVLGGVQVMGPLGIFVGPMIVALLQSLLHILNTELRRMDAKKDNIATAP